MQTGSIAVLSSDKNLSFPFSLTISVQEKGTETSGSSIFTAAYGPGTFKKEYEAAITWVRGSNDVDYIGMVDLIIITVTSEQVD